MKAKRGLGLLVVAAIAFLGALTLAQGNGGDATGGAVLALSWVTVGCAVGGLGLLAWGLLRD